MVARVAVVGDLAYGRADRVEWVLKWHRWKYGPFTLVHAGGDGPAADALAFMERARWPVEEVSRDWLFREGGATYLLAFGNVSDAVLSLARRNGVTVGEVP